jgi:hypothetical protein
MEEIKMGLKIFAGPLIVALSTGCAAPESKTITYVQEPNPTCDVTVATNGYLQVCSKETLILLDKDLQILQVKSIVDPCGNGKGFDEELYVTKEGQVLGLYQTKGELVFRVLQNGHGHTKDRQSCDFQILGGTVL